MIKVILTGATGMVGEGVLLECLENDAVGKVLVVGRRTCGYTHPKLEEYVHDDLMDLSPATSKLMGYDTCFFCAGVSSVRKSEKDYYKLTYEMTTHFAGIFKKQNQRGKLTFCYVSGYGTDSSEQGKVMWARVKGKTENKLIEMFGPGAYMFRPGYMKPAKGQKNILGFYTGWQAVYPILRLLLPRFTCTLKEVAEAMINAAQKSYDKRILEVKDIIQLSKNSSSQV